MLKIELNLTEEDLKRVEKEIKKLKPNKKTKTHDQN